MAQYELFDIPSPCIGVCEVNSKGYCKGCFRSRDERLHWLALAAADKRQVLRNCQLRRQRVLKAAGQQSGDQASTAQTPGFQEPLF